ncbi:MAG TPA: calcium:proton antiporter [Microbacterium sp.]|nr:calcium:proton antiporter [Microbacterium sp.]
MNLVSRIRTILTPAARAQLLLGWGAFLALLAAEPLMSRPLSAPALLILLSGIVLVIVLCAFGVVAHAEHLAHRLGDPYGTLVLTLSIVIIEVILISAVMLGPGEHTTIARDSVMAVSMIILNLVVGVALVVGGLRHGRLTPNRAGVGAYTPTQAVSILLLTIGLYAFFLHQQMGPRKTDFQERTAAGPGAAAAPARGGFVRILAAHRFEVISRAALLILTVAPIVLLSHDMAALLDDGLGRVGAPVALSGIVIALIVFLPETITTVRAAYAGEIQRVSNLCHGALVSTVGLTIPVVLAIGLATGQTVLLAETPVDLVLLALSVLLTITSFFGTHTTALHGGTHLMLFAVYVISVFS